MPISFLHFPRPPPLPPSSRSHHPAWPEHSHLDRFPRHAWTHRHGERPLAYLRRLVAAVDVGSGRMGYRGRRHALSHLLRRPSRPMVRAGSLRLSSPYIELHAGSAFSFLEGSALPEEFAGACAEYGMPAMALLDRDGVYGAPRFHLAATKAGIQAHIGAEVTSV